MAVRKDPGDAGIGKRGGDDTVQQGGLPGGSGTTDRDHGGKGSWRPDVRDERVPSEAEGGMEDTEDRGPVAPRRGREASHHAGRGEHG